VRTLSPRELEAALGSPCASAPANSRCPQQRSLVPHLSGFTERLRCEDGRHRAQVAACERVEVCEHEMQALEALRDARLSGVLQAMTIFRAEVIAALATLTPDASNGG
jgi:hypothetical protein